MVKFIFLCISSIYLNRSSFGENKARAVLRDYGYNMVGNTSLVSHDDKITSKYPCATPTKYLDFAMEQISATPTGPKNEILGNWVISQALRNSSIPPEIANVVIDS